MPHDLTGRLRPILTSHQVLRQYNTIAIRRVTWEWIQQFVHAVLFLGNVLGCALMTQQSLSRAWKKGKCM